MAHSVHKLTWHGSKFQDAYISGYTRVTAWCQLAVRLDRQHSHTHRQLYIIINVQNPDWLVRLVAV